MNGFQWINIISNEPWPAMATCISQLRCASNWVPQKAKALRRHRSSEQLFSEEHWPMGHGLRLRPPGARFDPTDPRFDVFSHWHFWVDFWRVKDHFCIFSGSLILLVGEINHSFPGGDLIDVLVAAQHCVTIRQCLCAHFEPDSPGITGDIICTRAQQAANKPMVLFHGENAWAANF